MVGRAVSRALDTASGHELVAPSRSELDLLDAPATCAYLARTRPDVVVHTAGRVGGIAENVADPTGFLLQNTLINTHVIGGALESGVPRLLNLGSSCMFPRDFRQPLVEDDLLKGELEPTNEGYALAKIMAERLCRYAAVQHDRCFRTLVPSNLYGPHDHFELGRAHLVAAAVAKVVRAVDEGQSVVEVWGHGTARREFTYVEDLAAWVVDVLPRMEELPLMVNVGEGTDHSVREYYEVVADVVGFTGELAFDTTRPAGMKQKLMDSSVARRHGWEPRTELYDGIRRTVAWYRAQRSATVGAVTRQ